MKNYFAFNLWLLLLLLLAFNAQAQKSVKVEDFKLNSRLMSREMPYRVIFPSQYKPNDKNRTFPVLYLLHGLSGHFNNWSDKTKLFAYSQNYQYLIVLVEGNDGWYSDSISVAQDKYESYIVQELIPEIDKKFRTKAKRESRAIAGLSMGGYGSLKFGIKYPDKFVLVGSFSGALDSPLRGQDHPFLRPSILSVFGENDSPARKDNDIFRLIRETPSDKIKQLPFLYLDCGTEDWLFATNRDFAKLLSDKRIPYEFRQLPGKHDWNFWDSQIVEFLEVTKKFMR